VLDYAVRWAIEPMFSDFKGRGFELEDSQLAHADRLERLILIMSLAMYWCVQVGQEDALNRPTPLEKKHGRKPIRDIGASGNSTAA
jgi:hypothetical protein